MNNHDTAHGACGKTWKQRGNITGHCSGCHETFEGVALFDKHRTDAPDGSRTCRNSESMEYPKGYPLKLVNGAWKSTKPLPVQLTV